MTIDTTDLIKALEERKRQLAKWTDKDRAKERIDEIDCILDTDVPYLVKEESEKPMNLEEEINLWISENENIHHGDKLMVWLLKDVARYFTQWGAEHLKK